MSSCYAGFLHILTKEIHNEYYYHLMLFVEAFAEQFSPVIIDLTSGARRAADGSHEFYKNLGYANEGPKAKLYFRKML